MTKRDKVLLLLVFLFLVLNIAVEWGVPMYLPAFAVIRVGMDKAMAADTLAIYSGTKAAARLIIKKKPPVPARKTILCDWSTST